METKREQTQAEEIANAIIHGVGAGLSIAALTILIVFAAFYGDAWHIVSFSIYGATLVLLYLASTLYHSFPKGRWKNIFQIIDHSSIFLLIAGTYTPITLTALRGPWGWSLFGTVWAIAIAGIIMKLVWFDRFRLVSLVLYAVMGWLIIVAIRPLLHYVNPISLIFLLVGGVSYSAGIIFYLRQKHRFSHAIWHLMVLAGSIFHFFGVFYLLEGVG